MTAPLEQPPEAPAAPAREEPAAREEPVPEPAGAEPTGHPAVDAALRALAEVAGDPPADQLPAYQAAHRSLREALASIDEG
jgi:hypothetical protein